VGFDALDLDQVDEIVAEPAAEDVVSEELADASDDADEASDSADQD
jgi:hypothetical protein